MACIPPREKRHSQACAGTGTGWREEARDPHARRRVIKRMKWLTMEKELR
ncbi:hypothetical protein JG687_00010374 [Phytophthora cactorum]|uniref:Uncharacterized protein n=1 Tax=Phytophthora cactorum TaxID=29920 RepID=A0A8T1U6Z1_9STRA|nr:hypothetical protein JG687_00010374 [Phytophthora cactorum]